MQANEYEHIRRRAQLTIERLDEWQLAEERPLAVEYRYVGRPTSFAERPRDGYRALAPGERWGNGWDYGWFRLSAPLPEGWRGRPLALRLDLCGEMMAYDASGRALGSLSRYSIYRPDLHKEILPIPANGDSALEVYALAVAQYTLGMPMQRDPRRAPLNKDQLDARVVKAVVGPFDGEVFHYRLDLQTLLGVMENWNHDWRCRRMAGIVLRSLNAYAESADNAPAARAVLAEAMAWPAEYYQPRVAAVGHAHIDLAWLWPVRESRMKAQRTFQEALINIERYPDFVFGASQPQLYDWVKQDDPALYARVKAAIAAGRWEPQGALWVEADTNIAGAEALARQFLHGKNFFRDEFGVDVGNVWLPDVFGYTGILPQLMKKSGCSHFLTTKLLWAEEPPFPHRSFRWAGIDGSEVLAHVPPEISYNSILDSASLGKANANFPEIDRTDEYLVLFGIGDGGGGPTRENIEYGRRQKNLAGCPRVEFGRADAFFRRLAERAETLPLWRGELYLALHRGTLTTIGQMKKYNRLFETRLRQMETLYTSLPAARYPAAALDRRWKTLLLNQFHDILPGSSIREVYASAFREFEDGLAELDRLRDAAGGWLLEADADALVLYNAASRPQTFMTRLPDGWAGATGEGVLATQREGDAAWARVDLPPQTSRELRRAAAPAAVSSGSPPAGRAAAGPVLENELVRYEFDVDGLLRRAYDKAADREVVDADRPGNALACYVDRPNRYDAWEVETHYAEMPPERPRGVSFEQVADGPARLAWRLAAQIGKSALTQTISLRPGSRRLDFETSVDWRENHRMLRVSFPVDVLAGEARFDLGFGHIRRSTARNTPDERAMFECAAHRYLDLSDARYGAALLNDGKYGHKAEGSVLDLNLLRAARYPDEETDRMVHHFTYSFLPHPGPFVEADVLDEAMALNNPPLRFEGRAGRITPPLRLFGRGVCLEALKKAEKSDAWIARLAEHLGGREDVELVFPEPTRLAEVDLMEWRELRSFGEACRFSLRFRPFEVMTLRMDAKS